MTLDELLDAFPHARDVDNAPADFRGGRAHGLELLDAIKPKSYAKSRNHVDGDNTRLSAHLRHGCLSLAECRDKALEKAHKPAEAGKLINEFAWRDYFQRAWGQLDDRVWDTLEPWKTGHCAGRYADELPPEIEAGGTGVDWVDHFADELRGTGYLHNHARMWLAAYVVHARGIAWQAGAAWFLRHLLDGDEASNNLSWQWVASTFSSKPYIANRGNVIKYTGDRFKPHAKNDPTDDSYANLNAKYFGDEHQCDDGIEPPNLKATADDHGVGGTAGSGKALCLVLDDALRDTTAAMQRGDGAVFVYDRPHVEKIGWGRKRLAFVNECVEEMGVEAVVADDPAEAVRDKAAGGGYDRIVTTPSPDPRYKRLLKELRKTHEVDVLADEPFVALEGKLDLKRFSRYWQSAKKQL